MCDRSGLQYLEDLLNRNRIYKEQHKIDEEQARRNREPLGDWQSPSDNQRWTDLERDLINARLKYNIEKTLDKVGEMELLRTQRLCIETLMQENALKKKEPVKLQARFCGMFFKSPPGSLTQTDVEKDNKYLQNLMNNIDKQLDVYQNILNN